MPSWSTLYPLYLHYRTDLPKPFDMLNPNNQPVKVDYRLLDRKVNKNLKNTDMLYLDQFNLSKKKLQMLYECEEERHVYKACLRELISLKKTDKHTSWKTADVSALYLS
jgi:hypothetical protein